MDKIIRKLLVIGILLVGLVVQFGLIAAYAQEPAEEEQPVIIEPSGSLSVSLEQFGHRVQTLNRNNPERFYRIDLPGNFEISETGNSLDLNMDHFPAMPDKPTVLRVEMNDGRIVTTIPITQDNAVSGTVRIDLPDGLLKEGYNYIRLNLDTSETCEDAGALLDLVVNNTSTLNFSYEQTPYIADLGRYPYPFVTDERQGLLRIPTVIVLPDALTPEDLSTAATIAAGLGQMSRGQVNLTAVPASELTPALRDQSHLIVVGQPGENALLEQLTPPVPIAEPTIQPGQGVLQEIVSPWNEYRLVLVVSGLDDEGVSKAGQALNRQAHFLGMQGPVAVVLDLMPLPEPGTAETAGISLASLGYQDQIVYGAKPRSYSYDFTLPLGWRLEELPYFVLKFSHANILDPYQSMIDVQLNGVPVGSAALDNSNLTAGELNVSLPERLLKSGGNRLEVTVDMSLVAGDKCRDASDRRAWTVISSDSEVFLPYRAVDVAPDLRLLPYPFSQSTGFDQTLIVLPDETTPQMLDDLMKLVALFGSITQPQYASVHVTYASQVDQEARASYHILLSGRPTQNALVAEVNDFLPQPFMPESDLLKPLVIDTVAFTPDANRDAGLLQIIPSPWNEDLSMLVISGTTDAGYRLAVEALISGNAGLRGNLAVIEPVFDPFATEPLKVSTYSVDTRPPQPVEEASTGAPGNATGSSALAGRWWK